MAPTPCPYQVVQKVQLISSDGREDAHVLSIHHTGRGVEIVVRTTGRVDAPGRTVNVFTTSGRSSWLAPVTTPATASVGS